MAIDPIKWYYSVDASTVLEITSRVRLPTRDDGTAINIGQHADAGSGWEGDLLVDDPLGDLIMLGYRRIYAVATGMPAGQQVVGNWFISNLRTRRMDGVPIGPLSRTYVVTMADENSLFSRRKFQGADADRTAQNPDNDIALIRWYLTTTEGNVFSPDETYIDTTGPVDMDGEDWRPKSGDELMTACFQASQKEYWAKYEEAAAVGGAIVSSSVAAASVITTTTAHGLTTGQTVVIAGHSGSTPTINGTRVVTVTSATTYTIQVNVTVGGTGGTSTTVGRYVICYFNPNTSELYTSTISLSNDPADINVHTGGLVYPLSDDAELDRAYGRMATQLIAQYKAGWVTSPLDTVTGAAYAYVDRTVPIPNTKTTALALAQVTTQQQELTIPDDETTTVWNVLNPAHLNLLMHGMRVPVKATHFPNYTEDDDRPGYATGFVWHRVKQRDIGQQGPSTFPVPLRLSPQKVAISPHLILYRAQSADGFGPTSQVAWLCSGDNDGFVGCNTGSYPTDPTSGPLETVPGTFGGTIGTINYLGFQINGTGVIDIEWGNDGLNPIQVFTAAGGLTVTVELRKNGAPFTGSSTSIVTPGGGSGHTMPAIVCPSVPVAPGDVFSATFYYSPSGGAMYIDGGHLIVTGGSMLP